MTNATRNVCRGKAKILSETDASDLLRRVDFKPESGRHHGELRLDNEIAPDICHLWEKESHRKPGEDRYYRDLGDVKQMYQKLLQRIPEQC